MQQLAPPDAKHTTCRNMCTCHPPCALRHPAATCAIRIRPTSDGVADYLNVAEMYLYDAADARITPLSARLSTTYDYPTGEAPRCFDGDLTTWCSTLDPYYGDPNPTLTVLYDCPGGKTTAARVVVHNRDDCCRHRLNFFSLEFVDASGEVDPLLTFSFAGSEPVFTVWGALCESLQGCSARHCLLLFQSAGCIPQSIYEMRLYHHVDRHHRCCHLPCFQRPHRQRHPPRRRPRPPLSALPLALALARRPHHLHHPPRPRRRHVCVCAFLPCKHP